MAYVDFVGLYVEEDYWVSGYAEGDDSVVHVASGASAEYLRARGIFPVTQGSQCESNVVDFPRLRTSPAQADAETTGFANGGVSIIAAAAGAMLSGENVVGLITAVGSGEAASESASIINYRRAREFDGFASNASNDEVFGFITGTGEASADIDSNVIIEAVRVLSGLALDSSTSAVSANGTIRGVLVPFPAATDSAAQASGILLWAAEPVASPDWEDLPEDVDAWSVITNDSDTWTDIEPNASSWTVPSSDEDEWQTIKKIGQP